MARFTRIEVALKMKETGLVPVFYHQDIVICKKILKACFDGGVRVFEFTNRGDYAHEVFTALNKYAEKELPEMILGIGSIIDAGTTSLYLQSGANFIVSPILNVEMVKARKGLRRRWSAHLTILVLVNITEVHRSICKVNRLI